MAYRLFYDEYYERLRRYLIVVTSGNEETTREALQSTLVRVVKHMKRFATEGEFWGWLTVLARSALVRPKPQTKTILELTGTIYPPFRN